MRFRGELTFWQMVAIALYGLIGGGLVFALEAAFVLGAAALFQAVRR